MDSLINWVKKHHTVIFLSVIAAVALGFFSYILENIYESDSTVVFIDNAIAVFVAENRVVFLNQVFLAITELGNTIPLTLAFTISIFFFLIFKKHNQLALIFLSFGGSAVITFVIKNIVQRARPIDGLITEHGFSFPSGHAFAAVCFWAVLFYCLSSFVKNRVLKVFIIVLGLILAALIGFSRIYIGVHWFSDVVASFLLSSAYSIIVIWLIDNKHKLISLYKTYK